MIVRKIVIRFCNNIRHFSNEINKRGGGIFWVRVKHALTRPRTPSHALSPPRPKTPRPLPAVRPPGVLPTVHPISDPYVHQ